MEEKDFLSKLSRLKYIECNLSAHVMKEMLELLVDKFPEYTLKLNCPDSFSDTVYRKPKNDWDDNYEYIFVQCPFGIELKLNKCHHNNFNIHIFFKEGRLYFSPNAYSYAKYIAKCAEDYILEYLNLKTMNSNKISFHDYSIALSKIDNFSLHNYKCDKEDLEKLGLLV